jgi:hypothetical protein
MLNPVQDGLNLELDSWSFGRGFAFAFTKITSLSYQWRSAIPFWATAAGEKGNKQLFTNNSLAAHPGGGSGSQGGAQQGTRARGEQYLDGPARSHTLAALELFVN